MSTRSNQAAVDQMNALLGKYGYHAQGVELHDCLHLKSAVTRVDAERFSSIPIGWMLSTLPGLI